MATIQHNEITDPKIHEPKGVATASDGEVYLANGAGSGSWTPVTDVSGLVLMGIYDINDLTTSTTPIPLTTPDTLYLLTNDSAGPATFLTEGIPGLSTIWNATTNRFAWSTDGVLSVGDTVDVRVDVEVTTTSLNTAVEMDLSIGEGGEDAYLPILAQQNFKATGTYRIVRSFSLYMGSIGTITNPSGIYMRADTAGATVKVNGWYVRVFHKND